MLNRNFPDLLMTTITSSSGGFGMPDPHPGYTVDMAPPGPRYRGRSAFKIRLY